MDAGQQGSIVVGVCSDQADLEQLPGWGTDTWGYHGDDGRAFDGNSGNGLGLPFASTYTAMDVIGCGIDMQHRDIFYTKNGHFIGKAFQGIRSGIDLHPCIGLNSPGESVIVNFGNQPFLFDIEKYIKV
ncbi:SPla/RYanodine receptor [Lichtheimia hyalospora FSU 10163]|nr:SPla/RYanodine receptor [Lichtheimia hyalospora FSU 10163]